jgi:hypothetical protein
MNVVVPDAQWRARAGRLLEEFEAARDAAAELRERVACECCQPGHRPPPALRAQLRELTQAENEALRNYLECLYAGSHRGRPP